LLHGRREKLLIQPRSQLWGYEDARLAPYGSMTEEDASIWAAAIDTEVSRPLGERPRDDGVLTS